MYKKYKYGGGHDDNFRLERIGELLEDAVDETLFTPVLFHVFPHVVPYSAKKYAQLLNTYSPTISMERGQRAGFLKEIETLIDEKFDGSIQKQYAITLTLAKRHQ